MTTYRIVCTTLENPTHHRHIVEVGTGSDPDTANRQWTVTEVRAALRTDSFYTQVGANLAWVETYDCGCGYKTIRTRPDASPSNNLDNLRQCSWKA